MRKFLFRLLIVAIIGYCGICIYMFVAQESFIFHPEKMSKSTLIDYGLNQQEVSVKTEDGVQLSGILCRTESIQKKGLVFFLHGNAGNLLDQKAPAEFYTKKGYDFFTFDYRGFGKSDGEIVSQKQFYSDIELMYKELKSDYTEDSIVVIGYSVGTAPASMIASRMNPSKLVLIAPYYSMIAMTEKRYPFIPTFLLDYKFETNVFLKEIEQPVLIIHGDKDEVLPVEGSRRLEKILNPKSRYVEIADQDHNAFEKNEEFILALSEFGL